ncbi:MAG: AAA family ATPase [Gammaproteobacteria bacterium]
MSVYRCGARSNTTFTVLIDEVENHLHPSMQRQILPNLLEAFPHINFIVSTHSPLIIGSVRNSYVYALRYNSTGKVVSEKLDLIDQAKTASEILDEVLGVSFTMPIWAEEVLNRIVESYSKLPMTPTDFLNMRKSLAESGLEKLMPSAIVALLEEKND